MRSGNLAQLKKTVKNKQRIKHTTHNQVILFNGQEFNQFIRARFVLTKINVFEPIYFHVGEYFVTNLIENITKDIDKIASKKVIDLTKFVTQTLNEQIYLDLKYFVKLSDIINPIIKFITNELQISAYFIVDNKVSKDIQQHILAKVLAKKLTLLQGVDVKIADNYEKLFILDNKLQLTTILELYRGLKTPNIINEPLIKDNGLALKNINRLTDNDQPNSLKKDFINAVIDMQEQEKILKQTITQNQLNNLISLLIPGYWQPNNEIFGWGHLLRSWISQNAKDLDFLIEEEINWNFVDRILAINNLNYQLTNNI